MELVLNSYKDLTLRSLAKKYLLILFDQIKGKKFSLEENVEWNSRRGKKKIRYDFIIKDYITKDIIGVQLKDWRRPIGVNVVMRFEKQIEECGLSVGLLIGNEFSEQALARERRNVILLSRGEIISLITDFGVSRNEFD
ncbi:MAG: restriction endonuclease [Candidatus Korarchaeota archaeon]|nr:restriction endonuclease [Candidatus Korarchaeota archaeon]